MTRGVEMSVQGGAKLQRHLADIARKVGGGGTVRVGFLEKARYSGPHPIRGTPRFNGPVAQVAFWNEFGTRRAPARPFFRDTIKEKSGEWGPALGGALKRTGYDLRMSLTILGTGIKDQIVRSIVKWRDPPNAQRTIDIKGFDDPLIDDGTMQRSVDFDLKARA